MCNIIAYLPPRRDLRLVSEKSSRRGYEVLLRTGSDETFLNRNFKPHVLILNISCSEPERVGLMHKEDERETYQAERWAYSAFFTISFIVKGEPTKQSAELSRSK